MQSDGLRKPIGFRWGSNEKSVGILRQGGVMNKSEMTEIVSMCSALDGQLVSESKVIMWLANV